MNLTPPYKKDFLYNPLSVDFENLFDTEGEDLNQPNIFDI
jgi:hypothetical protein